MTKVTFVSYDDEPPLGGQGVELRGMRTALCELGHEVATVAGRGVHGLRYPRVTGRAPLDFSLHLNRHPELVAASHPDVLHAMGGPGGVLLLRAFDAPLVYTANHTYRMAHRRGSPRRALSSLEARAYQRAARVLAISASTANAVRELGVPAERIEVLPPGVDVPEGPLPTRDRPRLLFAGRWEDGKGVLTAIRVMGAVLRRRTDAEAVVVGAGRLEGAVRRLASTVPGIEVRGHVDNRELVEEYSRAAIVLMPSRYEGLGLVALEAQAHGAVVAGFDVAGLHDAVADRSLLVDAEDETALTELCLALIEAPERRESLAVAARDWVRSGHSWSEIGRRLEEVYQAVLGG